jgi:hypothetical protein
MLEEKAAYSFSSGNVREGAFTDFDSSFCYERLGAAILTNWCLTPGRGDRPAVRQISLLRDFRLSPRFK